MKLDQLIEYNKIFFFKNYAENVAERLVPDLLFKKTTTKYEVKVSGLQFNFDIF